MQIMQELQTNRPNFLFKNAQDFNQTTDVGPQEPISSLIISIYILIALVCAKPTLRTSRGASSIQTAPYLP